MSTYSKLIVIVDSSASTYSILPRYQGLLSKLNGYKIDLLLAHRAYKNVQIKCGTKDNFITFLDSNGDYQTVKYNNLQSCTYYADQLIDFVMEHQDIYTSFKVVYISDDDDFYDKYQYYVCKRMYDFEMQPIIEFVTVFFDYQYGVKYNNQLITSLLGYLQDIYYVSLFYFIKTFFNYFFFLDWHSKKYSIIYG